MPKQTQQLISRFFSALPPTSTPPASSTIVAATTSFSPSKRKLLSSYLLDHSPTKKQRGAENYASSNASPLLHQRFLDKLLEPSLPIRDCGLDSVADGSDSARYTPLELQVKELKRDYPGVLLMVEVGYKYRFFAEDAEVASRVLGIYSHIDHNFLTASVPTFRLHVHVRRLVSEGYKVGVVKQTETAAIKAHGESKSGPFARGLSALYTKATFEAAESVGGSTDTCGGESNYLCCIVDKSAQSETGTERNNADAKIGVVAVEISTGDVVYGEFDDCLLRSGLEAFLLRFSPAELVIGEPLSSLTEKLLLWYAGPASNVRIERTVNCFSDGGALNELVSMLQSSDDDSAVDDEVSLKIPPHQSPCTSAVDGISRIPELAVQALALTARHLQQFGLQRILSLGASFRCYMNNVEINLCSNTIQHLEVLRNNSDGSQSGSLLHLINQTHTVYGSRLLRYWVTHPLCDKSMISARLDTVSEIVGRTGSCKVATELKDDDKASDSQPDLYHLLSNVFITLGRLPDIQRGITRIFHQTASTKEFLQVMQALLCAGKQLRKLCEMKNLHGEPIIKSSLLRKLVSSASSSTVISFAADLLSLIDNEAAEKGDLSNLFTATDGRFSEVGKFRKKVEMVKKELDSLIDAYRIQLKMRNLQFVSVSGVTHLIELPLDAKVPADWAKVNSTKKTVRYHPPQTLQALDKLALANEELAVVCRAAWSVFLKGFAKRYSVFQSAVHSLAVLDCLLSLATLSRNKGYVRPTFVEDGEPVQVRVFGGRHPVLETLLHGSFVPNDTDLHGEKERCQIVTGPNMGGKSCYIRQVALLCLLAQIGCFVPAESAVLHVVDNIFTRIGASDAIQRGRSTFLEEMMESSNILERCSNRSLVIMDELGRGTSTHDGASIAYAALDYLVEKKKALVLFVTHYPDIAKMMVRRFPGSVGAYHVSYVTSGCGDVAYLFKVVRGVSDKSFGLKVAQLAQLPDSCIMRADTMAGKLETLLRSRSAMGCAPFLWYLKSAAVDKDSPECAAFLEDARRFARDLLSHRSHFSLFPL